MGPYRFTAGFTNTTHRIYVLTSQPEYPRLFVLEPLSLRLRRRNHDVQSSVSARPARNRMRGTSARSFKQRIDLPISEDTRIAQYSLQLPPRNEEPISNRSHISLHFPFRPYLESRWLRPGRHRRLRCPELGDPFELDSPTVDQLDTVDAFSKENRLNRLTLGLDHLATRILSGEREDAILEFLDDVELLLLGSLQHCGYELVDERQPERKRRRRQALTCQGLHGEQHAVVRQLVRESCRCRQRTLYAISADVCTTWPTK